MRLLLIRDPPQVDTVVIHMIKWTRPSPSVIAYCKRSKTGQWEGLGTRLGFQLSLLMKGIATGFFPLVQDRFYIDRLRFEYGTVAVKSHGRGSRRSLKFQDTGMHVNRLLPTQEFGNDTLIFRSLHYGLKFFSYIIALVFKSYHCCNLLLRISQSS